MRPDRPLLLLPLLLLASGSACSAAQAPSAAEGGLFKRLDVSGDGEVSADEVASQHRRLFERLLRRADADENGALSAAEFAVGLTPDTAAKPLEPPRAERDQRIDAARLLLLKLDTNRDLRLTQDETPEALRGVFDQLAAALDGNKNGSLERRELVQGSPQIARRAMAVARRQEWDVAEELRRFEAEQGRAADRFDRPLNPAQALADPELTAVLFNQLDANGDGKLVRSEFPERLRGRAQLLRLIDADRDGSLSQQEFVAAAERLSRFFRPRQ